MRVPLRSGFTSAAFSRFIRVVLLANIFGMVTLPLAVRAARGESTPLGSSDGPNFDLPVSDGRLVYRHGGGAPQPVSDFRTAHGLGSQIFWDHERGTLRSLIFSVPVELGKPEAPLTVTDNDAMVRAVRAFIDQEAALIGVGSASLGAPYIYPLRDHRVLVFPQVTPGGMPVRGAHVRAVVLSGGRLGLVKAFVARGLGDFESFKSLPQDLIEQVVRDEGGVPHSARLEVGFPRRSLESALPIWSVQVTDRDGLGSEHIYDAHSGELLGCVVGVKHFDGQGGGAPVRAVNGAVAVAGPNLGDILVSPWSKDPPVQTLLEGVVTGEILGDPKSLDPDLRWWDLTNVDGSFGFNSASTLATTQVVASLKTGHLEECEDSPECKLTPVVQVFVGNQLVDGRPVNPIPPIERADNELDVELDQVPDVIIAQDPAQEYGLVFNAGTPTGSPGYRTRAHWVMCFQAAQSVTSFADETLRNYLQPGPRVVRARPFLPISHLCMEPKPLSSSEDFVQLLLNGVQKYFPPSNSCQVVIDFSPNCQQR
jgi:hypothetical protein